MLISGSSPRVRGIRGAAHRSVPACWFIPACAGNTHREKRLEGLRAVHPRVCGEYERLPPRPAPGPGSSPRVRGIRRGLSASSSSAGSSPRVRGIPMLASLPRAVARFIPACAGNTWIVPSQTRARPVHPRVCGEYVIDQVGHGEHAVHPRVCGEYVDQARVLIADPRFIPACAGNTSTSPSPAGSSTVHPRVCGEYS